MDSISDDDWLIVLDLGLKQLPSLIFLITSVIRYCHINHIAYGNRLYYSRLSRAKFILQLFMAAVSLVLIVLDFALPITLFESPWIIRYNLRLLSLIYLVNSLAWLVSAWLVKLEYTRMINEAWYTHKLFWSLNFVVELMITIFEFNRYVSTSLLILATYNENIQHRPSFCQWNTYCFDADDKEFAYHRNWKAIQ